MTFEPTGDASHKPIIRDEALEPKASTGTFRTFEERMLYSQAVSQKRAADALETIARDGIANVVQGLKLSPADIEAVIASRAERSR